MKKFGVILVSVVVVALMGSCSGKLSPTAYNQKVVALHDQAAKGFNQDMETLYAHNLSAEESKTLVDSLNLKYDGYIKQLNEINYPDGAENFHAAMLNLITFAKDSVITLFQETLQYKPESEQWYKVWREVDVRLKRSESLWNKTEDEQRAFASKSGYQVR
jgi:hypothetical protein